MFSILALTGMVIAILSPAQPTIVATFDQPQLTVVKVLQPAEPTVVADLEYPVLEGIPLEPAQPTIVKTWTITK